MVGPTATGNILMLYGHGAMAGATFDFRRADAYKINLYSWTREAIPVWDSQIQLAADTAIANGTIRNSYATVNSSRIGGTLLQDSLIGPPTGLALPTIPGAWGTTAIAALGATVRHNAATLAGSNRMVLMVNAGANAVRLSTIISNASFAQRTMDVLWLACKSA